MAKITAIVSLSVDIECPECKQYVDLTDGDDFWDGMPSDFTALHQKDVDVLCPECGAEFVCDISY